MVLDMKIMYGYQDKETVRNNQLLSEYIEKLKYFDFKTICIFNIVVK